MELFRCANLLPTIGGKLICNKAYLVSDENLPTGVKIVEVANIDPETKENFPYKRFECKAHNIFGVLATSKKSVVAKCNSVS